MAIDKPRDWMLVPFSWQKTNRNLQAALASSIAARDFWARSRGLRFLRFIHRLDAETTGILLLAKSQGAVTSYGALFESREMQKAYLAVVMGAPRQTEWTCRAKIGQDPRHRGKMKVDARHGKDAETHFQVLQTREHAALVAARPVTGRTHQIRVHLAESGHAVLGDEMYGGSTAGERTGRNQDKPRVATYAHLALRAVKLAYTDPFTRRRVEIRAPVEQFVQEYGFELPKI